MMALAIRCQALLDSGVISTYAELARLARVSRARVTQIMNLLRLAPDLQEWLLLAVPGTGGRDQLTEHAVRKLTQIVDWDTQRHRFNSMVAERQQKLR
jgi:hypothetical protein